MQSRNYWRYLLIFILSVITHGCATTLTGQAFDLIGQEQYEKALPILHEAVEQEESVSAALLASFLYLDESSESFDIDKAKEMRAQLEKYKDASSQQHLNYLIGLLDLQLDILDDVDTNNQNAFSQLNAPKYMDFPPALCLLSRAHLRGIGTKVDRDKAISYAKKAYQLAPEYFLSGDPVAQYTDINASLIANETIAAAIIDFQIQEIMMFLDEERIVRNQSQPIF